MMKSTIKWRIFKYNLTAIILLIALTCVIFNLAVNIYIQNNIIGQLDKIASNTETAALKHGPDYFPPPGLPPEQQNPDNKLFGYYLMLDRSLKEPLSLLNADFILLDGNENRINPFTDQSLTASAELLNSITAVIRNSKNNSTGKHLSFNISGIKYIAIIKPVYDKNSFGLGWIIIYSSLQKINQLQFGINLLLFTILIFSALLITIFSSILSKKITEPFLTMNNNIKAIAERNFSSKVQGPVYQELKELTENINIMSYKLESYDKAQKTFLQNVSHEFRTPLMSIQGYAEGIKYKVVDNSIAAGIIMEETTRMTKLVEDILYLSRLDSMEDNYQYEILNIGSLISRCLERTNGAALKNNISLIADVECSQALVFGDEEKLTRAITNIISNCLRYAKTSVHINASSLNNKVIISIEDDGPGFKEDEVNSIFQRFYKGDKGNHGLGLAISKNVIDKMDGSLSAQNTSSGALFKIVLHAS